jgi:hypothetical protein
VIRNFDIRNLVPVPVLCVFGPPGSGSVIYLYGSGCFSTSWIQIRNLIVCVTNKQMKKNLISTVLRLLYDFFIFLKNYYLLAS